MKTIISTLLVLCLTIVPASARNVDLSTVPARDKVQLTIYNSEDITLVKETRVVTFKKGVNPLQFSWANTLIDPTSVEMRFLSSADKLDVLDTTFPHDKPQMLYWNVKSDFDGEATIQITYFTSGITWSADYLAIADKDEKEMSLEGFVRVFNNSGEQYENAEIRLVVGTINLVEKIAQLAQVPMQQVEQLGAATRRELRDRVVSDAFKRAEVAKAAPAGGANLEQKQIVKEGLSEYFMYSIEGTETIPNGWSKRLRSFEGTKVPFKIVYRYRPLEYGEQLVRMYLLSNNEESKLGTTPLPDGVVRSFRHNGRDGLSFLTQQQIKYVPIGDKIELNLGPDPEVIFELVRKRVYRDNIWMQIHGADVFRRVDDGAARIEVNSSVAGWDDHDVYLQRIRNYTSKAIDVEIRRQFGGHAILRSQLKPRLHDFNTVELKANVQAANNAELWFEVLTKQGRNATQNNVTLEEAAVTP